MSTTLLAPGPGGAAGGAATVVGGAGVTGWVGAAMAMTVATARYPLVALPVTVTYRLADQCPQNACVGQPIFI